MFCLFFAASAVVADDNYIDELGTLVEEISLLNVLRGLYLSEEQARQIAALAIEAENIRSRAKAEIVQLQSTEAFRQLRDELYTALVEDPPPIRDRVVELDNRAHAITGIALDKIARLEDDVRKILTHGQQKIVWEFVPCIVPELDFENPVRTGQAEASSRLLPALKLIRETPEDMWKKHGQDYLDHILKVTEQEVGKMTDDTRDDLRRRLVKHAWKIRKMNEADFMINRDRLAEELLLINREHTLRSGHRITGKIARFLLSSHAARVLPKWVETHFNKGVVPSLSLESDAAPASESAPVSESSEPRVVPASSSADNLDQSRAPVIENPVTDADSRFWGEQVPESLARLAETPFFDHVYHAFGQSYSRAFFDENNQYVDIYRVINGAGKILAGERPDYYSLTPGEP